MSQSRSTIRGSCQRLRPSPSYLRSIPSPCLPQIPPYPPPHVPFRHHAQGMIDRIDQARPRSNASPSRATPGRSSRRDPRGPVRLVRRRVPCRYRTPSRRTIPVLIAFPSGARRERPLPPPATSLRSPAVSRQRSAWRLIIAVLCIAGQQCINPRIDSLWYETACSA